MDSEDLGSEASRPLTSLLHNNNQRSSETGSTYAENASQSSHSLSTNYANISSSLTLSQMEVDLDGLSELDIQRSFEIERENSMLIVSGRNAATDSTNASISPTFDQLTDSDVPFQFSSSCSSESHSSASLSLDENNHSDSNVSDSDGDNEFNPEWINQLIFPDSILRGGDALCHLLNVYVTNRLTKKALEDILNMVNIFSLSDHSIARTKYQLLSLIEKLLPHSHNQSDYSTKHRICTQCFFWKNGLMRVQWRDVSTAVVWMSKVFFRV